MIPKSQRLPIILGLMAMGLGGYLMQGFRSGGEAASPLAGLIATPTASASTETSGRSPIEASLDGIHSRLVGMLTAPRDVQLERSVYADGIRAHDEGNVGAYQAALLRLKQMADDVGVACLSRPDMGQDGHPVIQRSSNDGFYLLRATCWADGEGVKQTSLSGRIFHAADYLGGSPEVPETVAFKVSKMNDTDMVYGTKVKGHLDVDWNPQLDAVKP